MTPRTGPAQHASVEELADAAEGLLGADAAAQLRQHLSTCAECRARNADLGEVGALLAAVPAPAMPASVVARLNAAVRQEQQRREPLSASVGAEPAPTVGPRVHRVTGPPYGTKARPHPSLGRFGADLRKVSAGRRWGIPVLAAAAAAAVVGFGTYVLSAGLGLDEPPAVSVTVNNGQLGPQASALRQRTDLEPHRFSQAWWCARRVTDAPIVGLATIRSGGEPALLVYTRTDRGPQATVVRGCDRGDPQAGPSVLLGR